MVKDLSDMANTRKPPASPEDWQFKIYDIMEAFTPGAPIDELQLLAGRTGQIDQMIDTLFQRGQHAVLYGERGVGKSSLANTFSKKIMPSAKRLKSIVVNCDPSDDFTTIWKKVFRRLLDDHDSPILERYANVIYPDDVVVELSALSLDIVPVVILDEFDKVRDIHAKTLIANTIKSLSDSSARVTVIVVGVADSVSDLIAEHQSIARCLRQIPMQRMATTELSKIIVSRLDTLAMKIQQDALAYIIALCRGLPHYAHLLGQRAAKKAAEKQTITIESVHVESALSDCVRETDQTIRQQYQLATISPRADNIYREVLLAAALSAVDDLGYFQPVALRGSLKALLRREDAPVSLFGQHLKILCTPERGSILEVTGTPRRFRYRFVEPMMQPFILMNGLQNSLITKDQVRELATSYYEPRLSSDF
jgi:Cdc6-like AAA superfamily ATPase